MNRYSVVAMTIHTLLPGSAANRGKPPGAKEGAIMVCGNDDFFGGTFDFNGDGRTGAAEAALGYQILDEMSREDDDGKIENDKEY